MRIALYVIDALVCLVLIASVLLQPGKSAGLSGSIAGGAEQLFGKKKGSRYEELASKATTISAVLFMVLSLLLLFLQ